MQKIYRIFISSAKNTLENERQALINNILLQNCIPISMEYFVNPNNISTLTACINAIDSSDGVILIIKSRYGSKIDKAEIDKTFPCGCPLSGHMCDVKCNGKCELSYTHFEYFYAKLKTKIIFVMSNMEEMTGEIVSLLNDARRSGCYNVYTDLNSFNATSTTIISKIINACNSDDNLGLVPATLLAEMSSLRQRVNFLESNFYNGFIPKRNFMGCLFIKGADDFLFYVYKEMKLREARTGFDFSIHINIGDKSKIKLTKSLVEAHAYVKYQTNEIFTRFYECKIAEKSYGHEYLNCHIEFLKQNDVHLPIKKGDIVAILYTYRVKKSLYGNEIGRQLSPFFEEMIVELAYNANQNNISFDCFEKVENSLIDVGLDSNCIQPCQSSFLQSILTQEEIKKYIEDIYNSYPLEDYTFKQVRVPAFYDENGNRRLTHFYVKWSE